MSKFEKYLLETQQLKEQMLMEQVDIILEKLGSVDAMDASILGIPANVPLTAQLIKNAFLAKKGKMDIPTFMSKLKTVLVGASPNELENIKLMLELPTANGGDQWGKSSRLQDTR